MKTTEYQMETLQEYYNRLFIYRNGELYRKSHIKNQISVESVHKIIKEKGNKYRRYFIKVGGKSILMHKVIWVMHNGEVPKGKVIDHIDEDSLNPFLENLQLLTNQENLKKARDLKKHLISTNTSSFIGVSIKSKGSPKPWAAEMRWSGGRHSKCFETAKEAAVYRDKYIDDHNLPLVKNLS